MPATHETWFPLYVADYLRDTQKLQAEQHGAYLLLLMEAWTHGGAIPEDPEELGAFGCPNCEGDEGPAVLQESKQEDTDGQ